MLTAIFSEARQNLTEIADRMANEGVEYTIFKRSKPLFKIVPVDASESEREATPHRSSTTRQEAARRAVERAQEGATDTREALRERARGCSTPRLEVTVSPMAAWSSSSMRCVCGRRARCAAPSQNSIRALMGKELLGEEVP